ncbi:hypothetical protein K490DRAFT_30938, partial [Saccharata proteae CBS 121410]
RSEDGGWRMEDGGARMEDGGWRMEDGGWRSEDGGWRIEDRTSPALVERHHHPDQTFQQRARHASKNPSRRVRAIDFASALSVIQGDDGRKEERGIANANANATTTYPSPRCVSEQKTKKGNAKNWRKGRQGRQVWKAT